MEMSDAAPKTAWQRGRFDARRGPSRLLFGRMHEDSAVERAAFPPDGRVFCIASAGCTAIELAQGHEIVAVDLNPVQVAYARRRFAGAPFSTGAAERMMGLLRFLAPLAGWRRMRIREFLDLDDPVRQIAFWRRHLDTRRFRVALDAALSRSVLGTVYAGPFLRFLPSRFGRVMRGRMARCFARHPNRENPYARALLAGMVPEAPRPPRTDRIRLVHDDAASFLEREPPESFDGFALSNILDGADEAYRRRLLAAVKRAAAPGAVAVIRSFAEPRTTSPTNLAAEDRSMLWGIVDAKPAAAL